MKEYQRWDRSRRVLEYIIHETEMLENKKKLEDVIFLFRYQYQYFMLDFSIATNTIFLL